MTIEQLRKQISVTHWEIDQRGMRIDYMYNDTRVCLLVPPKECAIKLSTIGSIDSWEAEVFLLNYENQQLHWLAFVNTFKLSQWEALTLVIRHEYEKELEKDTNLLEMDSTIKALKNL